MKMPGFRPALLLLSPLFLFSALNAQTAAPRSDIEWISSTQSAPYQHMPTPLPSAATPTRGTTAIQLDPHTTFQRIDGFGGCFNDLGWQALQALDEAGLDKALRSLFSREGANFTLGRAPIGANDFSLGWYSYDETPGDYTLKNFSIEHDRKTLIPFIDAAMKYQPNLGVWSVPWSPPTWMKTNGAYKGGSMKEDSATLASYALYFSKYIQEYRKAGINLYAVMPQNEPKYNDNVYPQAVWSGKLMNLFLRDHLIPQLKKDNIDIQVWQGTIVNEKLEDYILPVLDDPATSPHITGVAYQYGGQQALLATHQRYPDKKLMQSETECYNGENDWQQGLITYGKIISDTNHFAGSYFFWNTVLNDESKSSWGWKQNSLLTVNRTTKEVRYNPEFYSMKHFSANVLPGAERVAVTGGPFKEVVAFHNPSGSNVLEFANDSEQSISATIAWNGESYQLAVPAKSMNTVVLPSSN